CPRSIESYLAGARDGATSRRGKEHERGRLPLKLGRKNGREAAIEHHAQNGLPLHERVGPLRGSEPHHPGSGWPTMTSISLLWGIGPILSDEEIKEIVARRVKQ